MDFPSFVSSTVTNACDLRCPMCGRWSEHGYVRNGVTRPKAVMAISDWKRLVDEAADHEIGMFLLRGGEPFLVQGIVELIEHIGAMGIFTSIDSNGMHLEEEYRNWFSDPVTPVRLDPCHNTERLIDIQPTGEANFCVDFPDYSLGNVRDSTLAEQWNGARARKFRERRRQKPFSACHRCGAKFVAMIRE